MDEYKEYDEYEDDDYEAEEDLAETETVPRMGFFKRMFGVFYAPIRLFENLRVHGGIGAPLVLITLLSVLVAVISYWYVPMQMRETFRLVAERFGKDFVNLLREMQGEGNNPSDLILVGLAQLGNTAFGALLSSLVGFLALKIAKSEAGFGKVLAVFLTISTVELLGGMLSIAVGAVAFTTMDLFSLAIFSGGSSTPGYYLLNAISLFTLAGMALTFFGLVTLSKLPKRKAFTVAAIVVVIQYGTSILLASQTSDPTIAYEFIYRNMSVMQAQ